MTHSNPRHRTYADIQQGSDLFENIAPIDQKDAKKFRQNGKMFNVTVPHQENCKILGISTEIDIEKQREVERKRLEKVKSRCVSVRDSGANSKGKKTRSRVCQRYWDRIPACAIDLSPINYSKIPKAIFTAKNSEAHCLFCFGLEIIT